MTISGVSNSWTLIFVSMAAKMSERGDNMSEANTQADGLVERPAQGAADWQEMEEEDSSPITG